MTKTYKGVPVRVLQDGPAPRPSGIRVRKYYAGGFVQSIEKEGTPKERADWEKKRRREWAIMQKMQENRSARKVITSLTVK